MAAISNEHLRQIAHRIMGEPGFSTDGQGLERAHKRWIELTEPGERFALERALFVRWLEDLRAERSRPRLLLPSRRAMTVPGLSPPGWRTMIRGSSPERVAQVSDLRFRSESPDWRPDDAPAAADDFPGGQHLGDTQRLPAAGDQVPVPATRATAPTDPPPVRDQRNAPRSPAPVTVTNIGVQQPSRKVAAYRQMFPELAFPVQTASGAKPLAEFTERDIDYRIGQLREQRQDWRRANAGDEARIEERERLNVRDRVRMAERRQNIGDTEAEEVRLAAAKREVAANGFAVIGELSPEALAACGFKRRVA